MRTREEVDENSNLVEHARRELRITGWYDEPDGDAEFADSLINAVAEFTRYGHSGGSVGVAIHMLSELLQFHPLSPLTDDPAEWQDVSEYMDRVACWQNRRDGRMFSYDHGKTWYSVDDPRWHRRWSVRAWLWRRHWNKARIAAGEAKFN